MGAYNKPLLVAGAATAALFCVVALFGVTGWSRGVDGTIIAAFRSAETAGLTAALKVVTFCGELYSYLVVCVVVLAIPRSRLRYGAPLLAACLVSGGANWVLKAILRVARPDSHRLIVESGFSFPSGHAMFAVTFTAMLTVLLWRQVGHRAVVVAISGLLGVFAVVVGLSRVYLGVHWPIDILGGYLAGFVVFVGVVTAWDVLSPGVIVALGRRWPRMAPILAGRQAP